MSDADEPTPKNPRRVAAGRLNGAKRRAWTDPDRVRLAGECRRRQPWRHSTGPRTAAGKRRAAANGRMHLPEPRSLRQLLASLADVPELIRQMKLSVRELEGVVGAQSADEGTR